jgi:3-dehydroquinate dehydratase I
MACAIDVPPAAAHHSAMADAVFPLAKGRASVIGSFGGAEDLRLTDAPTARAACDSAEIRLDLLAGDTTRTAWRHLAGLPLLFTARRGDEGGSGDLSSSARIALLETAIDDAACIDIEVASISEMDALLKTLRIPWIASFHDFAKLPETSVLENAARRAMDAGASAFKAAAMLHSPADMARLADFQLADHGIPVATMGMGPLAPVSRLLCAQCGSVLNYGYLGQTPTAPGQWDAGSLKQAIARLAAFRAQAIICAGA